MGILNTSDLTPRKSTLDASEQDVEARGVSTLMIAGASSPSQSHIVADGTHVPKRLSIVIDI